MPVTLTRFVFAAAMACAAFPVWGAGLPDYGTKNFDPGGATPSYFTNENSSVLGSAENENTDDGADVPTRSVEREAESERPAGTTGHRHGRYTGRKAEAHAATQTHKKGHASQSVGTRSARATSIGRSAKSSRSEHVTEAAAKARTAISIAPGSSHTKSAKSNTRHASARFSSRKG
jgi:hypothetical protein